MMWIAEEILPHMMKDTSVRMSKEHPAIPCLQSGDHLLRA